MPAIRGQPNRGISGTSVNAARIVATLNIAGERAGMKNRRSELSMPIIATLSATIGRNGSMMRVRTIVSSSFPGTVAYSGAIAPHQCRRDDPGHDDAYDCNHEERVDDEVAETPCRLAAAYGEVAGERRDERRAHRAFGEEISQEVGNAERHVEGVHVVARAEQRGQDDFAGDAEHATRHGGRANQAGRPCETCAHALPSAYHSDVICPERVSVRIRALRTL